MYFAFRNSITLAEKKNLAVGYCAWGILGNIAHYFLFSHYGIHAPVYKFVLIMGVIPYLVIFVVAVRRNFTQHFFVFGMSSVRTLILHNFAAIIVVSLFESELAVIFAHAMLYLLLFAASLPLAKRFFVNLLSPNK